VGELGYVFRDAPWKTLSFFDETSADSALLDLFSVVDEPTIEAGRVNLNSPQSLISGTAKPVIQQALLSGTSLDPDGTNPIPNPDKLATAYSNYSYTSSSNPTATMPTNVAQLANFISHSQTPLTGAGLDQIKYHQEGIVRAMASSTQTRTWNLLIDVVAQTGRYPSTATSLNNFLVEGEKRYWLSIAIDRYTGKIVDQQLEPVNE
jgi:hypothetical protein